MLGIGAGQRLGLFHIIGLSILYHRKSALLSATSQLATDYLAKVPNKREQQ